MQLTVPSSLLTCEAAPSTPQGAYTSKDVATFTAHLYGAWEDCSGNLAAVKDVLAKQTAQPK